MKKLRCEYRINPIGIDVLKPRLSWVVEGLERGEFQRAYQIIASSTKLNMESNICDLWDSGRIASDKTNQIVYNGKPLSPRMECWWKVRVWNKHERASEWSEPAFFTIGLLEPSDWRAKWIGYDKYAEWEKLNFDGCKWIWANEGNPLKEAPVADRYFRRVVDLPIDRRVRRGVFLVTADDEFLLFVNGDEAGRSDDKPYAWQRPKTIEITNLLHPGENVLAIMVTNKGGPAGVLGKLMVEFEDGGSFTLVTDGNWKVLERAEEGWNRPDFEDVRGTSVLELGDFKTAPWGILSANPPYVRPLPLLRKSFTVSKPIRRALVYVSALGSCELHLNGKRVTEDYFIPGWSDFRKRAYYRTYEVTDLLRVGKNSMGAILNAEWYSGYQGGWGRLNKFGRGPRLLIQIEIEYVDGERDNIISDETWKATHGPILGADNYMGETYDARYEVSGWDEPWFDDADWKNVSVDDVNLQLTAHPGESIRKIMELRAQSMKEVSPGAFVYDFGQNMVGIASLRVKNAKPGTKITLHFAEVLNPDGTLHTANLRGALATDVYVCRGDAEEVFEPRFTYHGFRYVEVTGYPERPPMDAIRGAVLHSDIPIVGEFECSNPLLNRLVQNILWSLRGNYFEVPTDCPQRDERQGWTGDAQIFVRTATYLADVSAFMTKWLIDLNDSQREDGAYPDVAPAIWAGFGTPAWGDAGIVIPYVIWRAYGDSRAIWLYYNNMACHIDYLVKNSKDFLRPEMGYGDWVPAGSETPRDVLATAYFAYVVRLMVEMAQEIGKTDDVKRYKELFEKIRSAFVKAYVQVDGRMKGETQTCYALALDLNMLPKELEMLALRHLIKDIEDRGWHLSTGFVGTRHLMVALKKFDRADVAYKLLLQETYPSWLYPVKLGATTIWERWNSMTEEGIHEPGMNSFNHYAFGSVGEWLFSTVAGIDVEDTGFKRILIKPHLLKELGHVRAKYESINGVISVEWWFPDDSFRLQVTIPANTSAMVYVPTDDPKKVRESRKPAEESEGIQFIRMEGGYAVYRVLSGNYSFTVI